MSWSLKLIWFLLGFATCLVLLLLIPLKFDWELKVTDLLQLIVAVIIAILIQMFATETYSDRRVAKNLLIARVDETLSHLQGAHKVFLDCIRDQQVSKENAAAILALGRNISNSIKQLENGLNKCRMKAPSFESVKSNRRDYNRALTGRGFPAQPYPVSSFGEENELYNLISDELESMRYEINNW